MMPSQRPPPVYTALHTLRLWVRTSSDLHGVPERCPHLLKLGLWNRTWSPIAASSELLHMSSSLHFLTDLHIHCFVVTADFLSSLAHLDHLVYLGLTYLRMTDAMCAVLGEATPRMQRLSLGGNDGLTTAGVRTLALKMTGLSLLYLCESAMDETTLSHVFVNESLFQELHTLYVAFPPSEKFRKTVREHRPRCVVKQWR